MPLGDLAQWSAEVTSGDIGQCFHLLLVCKEKIHLSSWKQKGGIYWVFCGTSGQEIEPERCRGPELSLCQARHSTTHGPCPASSCVSSRCTGWNRMASGPGLTLLSFQLHFPPGKLESGGSS